MDADTINKFEEAKNAWKRELQATRDMIKKQPILDEKKAAIYQTIHGLTKDVDNFKFDKLNSKDAYNLTEMLKEAVHLLQYMRRDTQHQTEDSNAVYHLEKMKEHADELRKSPNHPANQLCNRIWQGMIEIAKFARDILRSIPSFIFDKFNQAFAKSSAAFKTRFTSEQPTSEPLKHPTLDRTAGVNATQEFKNRKKPTIPKFNPEDDSTPLKPK